MTCQSQPIWTPARGPSHYLSLVRVSVAYAYEEIRSGPRPRAEQGYRAAAQATTGSEHPTTARATTARRQPIGNGFSGLPIALLRQEGASTILKPNSASEEHARREGVANRINNRQQTCTPARSIPPPGAALLANDRFCSASLHSLVIGPWRLHHVPTRSPPRSGIPPRR